MEPLVSIIIPVYNVEWYLKQCIESILNQTYKNLEIILVNDGSEDKSGLLCEEYAGKDQRIKAIHKENGGLSSARNTGLSVCSGEFVSFVDSDDWLELTAIEEAVKAALETSADIIFWGYIKEFGDGNKKVRLFLENVSFSGDLRTWLHRRMVGLLKEELKNPTSTDFYNSAWGKLYKKALISENKIYFLSERLIGSEDVFFNIEVFGRADKVCYLDRVYYHYRQDNPKALTKNHKNTLFPRFLNLFRYIGNYIEANKLNEEYQLALRNRIALSVINNLLSVTSNRNEQNAHDKIETIKFILNNDVYRDAIKSFEIKYLPFHWKVFFTFCRYRFTKVVFLAGLIMRMLR